MEQSIKILYIEHCQGGVTTVTLLAYLIPYAVAYGVPALIVLLAARQDWRELRIDNRHSLVLAVLYPVLSALIANGLPFFSGVLAALLVLCIGLVFYALKWLGGGDVKLASAIGLYLGLDGLSVFALGTALAGGVLAVMALTARRYKLAPANPADAGWWLTRIRRGGSGLPYAVAMAVPACFLLTQRLIAAYHYFTHY